MKSEGRSTTPVAANSNRIETVSGSKALNQATQLLFETGDLVTTGVDLADLKGKPSRLGAHARQGAIGLAGLSEPETMRHYVRLSQQNYAIDLGVYLIRASMKKWRVCPVLRMCIRCSLSKLRKVRSKSCMSYHIG